MVLDYSIQPAVSSMDREGGEGKQGLASIIRNRLPLSRNYFFLPLLLLCLAFRCAINYLNLVLREMA